MTARSAAWTGHPAHYGTRQQPYERELGERVMAQWVDMPLHRRIKDAKAAERPRYPGTNLPMYLFGQPNVW